MGNCLVTKLKSVVNNDNLPYLEKLVFKPGAGNTVYIQAYGTGSTAPKLYGVGAPLLNNDGTEASNPTSMSSNSVRKFIAATNNDYVYYDNKYLITHCKGYSIPTSKLKTFDECVNVEYMDLETHSQLEGDISDIIHLTKLKTLWLTGQTSLTGNMEDLIAAIIHSGRTTGVKNNGLDFARTANNYIKFADNISTIKTTNGYFCWAPTANAGEYTIGYYGSSDDSLKRETTISIDNKGYWTRVS